MERIKTRLPNTQELFLKDLDAQDVIVLNLTRAVQLSVDLAMYVCANSNKPVPQTMGGTFELLLQLEVLTPVISEKMKKSVGFRNIAVHNYDDIDLRLAYTIAKEHRMDFLEFIKQISSYLER